LIYQYIDEFGNIQIKIIEELKGQTKEHRAVINIDYLMKQHNGNYSSIKIYSLYPYHSLTIEFSADMPSHKECYVWNI